MRAIKAGAVDFLPKPVDGKLLLQRVRAALAIDARQRGEQAGTAAARTCLGTLTPRERQVMMLAITGASSKDIARRLGISYRTVEVHRGRVMQKMQAGSLVSLAAMVAALELDDRAPLPPAPGR